MPSERKRSGSEGVSIPWYTLRKYFYGYWKRRIFLITEELLLLLN